MSQMLPYDENQMWHGHPDLYINKLEEIFDTPDDGDIGYSVEVDLRCPDKIIEKTTNFPFALEKKIFLKKTIMIIRTR